MDSNNIICPVCTLYLRPGITLKQHLSSHPKQKVIEALVRLSSGPDDDDNGGSCGSSGGDSGEKDTPSAAITTTTATTNAVVNQNWNQQNNALTLPPTTSPIQGNHVFIYQQSMSSTSTSQPNVMSVDPVSQQYIIPTILNPQMMPYVYQQQQLIMSSNSCVPQMPRSVSFAITPPPSTQTTTTTTITTENEQTNPPQQPPVTVKEVIVLDQQEEDEEDTEKNEEDEEEVEKSKQEDEVIEMQETINKCEDNDNKFEDDNVVDTDDEHDDIEAHSPSSSDWNLRVRSDLNKACQTNNTTSTSPTRSLGDELIIMENDEQRTKDIHPEYYFVNENDNSQYYEQNEPIYTSTNILQNTEHLGFVNIESVDMVMNDFSTNQIISQVENFENIRPDRGGVLMTIGGMIDNSNDQRGEDESRESLNVNIRADEKLPPRGELSGQESIGGASDITWNRGQFENATGICSSYDLIARETWEASDSSDVEVPPLQSRLPQNYQQNDDNIDDNDNMDGDDDEDDNDTPTIVSVTGPPLNFKCSTCGEAFIGSKERREHEAEKHPDKLSNIIGADIGKKNVKKLVIRLKSDKSENCENNFDNVFTNKLKIEKESPLEQQQQQQQQPQQQDQQQQQQQQQQENTNKVEETESEVKVLMCATCNLPFANLKELRQHKSSVHNIATSTRYKCSTCSANFANDYSFTMHLNVHPLECKLCGKLFYRRQNMQLHMRRHLGIKPYKCDICEKSFLTKQKHDEHRNTHTGLAPIKCHLCDETFRRHSNLVQHRNRHHLNIKKKIKDYICFCKEVFHSKKKLAWHMETHDKQPKSCTQCSEKFIHMASLTRHMRRAHNQRFLPNGHKDNENVECPICKGVYLKSSLDVHIRNHSGQRPFTCLICNKDFTTKWNLKLHKWTHASRISKPYKCDQCKGAFIRESDYISHMNSHKSIRPYTCNYCGAQFIRKYNCQRHVKEHENDKTFVCKVCGKSFHRSYYLKDHMRVHSGVRPYSCHICGKTSTTKSNHNKHVQIHHAREPVSTEN